MDDTNIVEVQGDQLIVTQTQPTVVYQATEAQIDADIADLLIQIAASQATTAQLQDELTVKQGYKAKFAH